MSMWKLSPSSSVSESGLKEIQPVNTFQAPTFAQSVYPLLLDLHNIFIDLPSIGRALAFAQKMLDDVNRGEAVDTQIISEVHTTPVPPEVKDLGGKLVTNCMEMGLNVLLNLFQQPRQLPVWVVGFKVCTRHLK
ncbi:TRANSMEMBRANE PROTEIN [Salix koriyanagi]|uniref:TRANSMEMBRANE PROTEIN n=1 Tax=Salix koriyanagi TaxID=2511006 RepID=A0A9Q0PMI5_9ROSI|nr:TRANSMEMBRANE PROTEIN [Salix koriyanagi]